MSRSLPVSLLSLSTLLAVTACDAERRTTPVLATELDKICHAVERSGAAGDQTTNRTYLIATWLDQNVTSDQGRAWLVSFARLGDDRAARRKLLADAAREHGIADCPLVDFWK